MRRSRDFSAAVFSGRNISADIHPARTEAAHDIGTPAGESPYEILNATGVHTFHFKLDAITARFSEFLTQECYFAFVVRGDDERTPGFIAICVQAPHPSSTPWISN